MIDELNTIYIISKGRPQCRTAKTLIKMNYNHPWFIVVGNNDNTLSEYETNYPDHIIVFDWYNQVKNIDTLDNFGIDNMPSGATPVRNAVREISESRGEKRHWQFDDDYDFFQIYDVSTGKNRRVCDGEEFYGCLSKISNFAYLTNSGNAGFCQSTMEGSPNKRLTYAKRVFNAHNLPSDKNSFLFWRGRLNDDLINALEMYHNGRYEFSFKFLQLHMLDTQQEQGGLTDIYKEQGTVRKTAYALLIAPYAVKLIIKFGRYHHRVNWKRVVPKIINSSYKK